MKRTFYKYSGNGNDFILLEGEVPSEEFIRRLCDRHFGVGADGVLLLGTDPTADARMRIFNADGGEAEMCGNGLRCLVTHLDRMSSQPKSSYQIRTMNHLYEVGKSHGTFAIHMSAVSGINAVDLSSFKEFEKKFFVNTGVPHLVFLSSDVMNIDIKKTAPFYRHHALFPNGTNVSFVGLLGSPQSAYVRTFERGVEDETFSCGTGLTATGLALSHWFGWKGDVHLFTKGGQQTVSIGEKIYYSGEVTFCFQGEIEP